MTKKKKREKGKKKKRDRYDSLCLDSRHYTYLLFLRVREKNEGLERRSGRTKKERSKETRGRRRGKIDRRTNCGTDERSKADTQRDWPANDEKSRMEGAAFPVSGSL